ncbi:maleylpyruvate isomerase family mycothiol-dependent enzyme [Iamia sp. SCSIO 61187]|uniref:maleylpyruvate isomerase family mycothiol-dependent enzyme n=1 Tax=Iamia sp. SCSIO 61187 TaxID=2722752 RepID=UPI001C62A4C7|nr:maleylpyruvate isomerase family mycothiol-dependent enzyme [Iamia sp. SCSIO 61187]QYG92549.1 maleylpyruvate isomerase family mycothiol-dependent enzyme [Iamia sp. SCSIO 61187]
MRDDFLRGARAVLAALSDPAVAAAWDQPSVLADQTVGGLAGHLARGGVWVVDDYLDLDPPSAPSFTGVADYFTQVAAMGPADHQAIRDRGAAIAANGPEAVVARLADRLAGLEDRLPGEAPDRLLPVSGGAMALDAYLGTRLVEQVVHLDDLARSLGATSSAPPDLVVRVAHLGLAVAVERHGAPPVLRHLFRTDVPGPAVVPVLA